VPNQEAFDSDDDAAIVEYAERHKRLKGRFRWKGCQQRLFRGRAGITDETVRERYRRIKRNQKAAEHRLDARESDAAHEFRRFDAHRQFAELTAPGAMAQLHTCAFCERAVFLHEIHKSPSPAFSAAADEERGDEPATFTGKQFVEYLESPPEYTTYHEALGESEPEEEDEDDLPATGARRRDTRGFRRLFARRGKRNPSIPATAASTRAEGRGLHNPQARTMRPGLGTTFPWSTYSMQSSRGPRTCSKG